MWDKLTSIDDVEVMKIKNIIQELEIVDERTFEIRKNFDVASGAIHYPIVFIIDVSKSLANEIESLNKAISAFVKGVYESRTALSASIDFCMITFNNKIKVKRSFGYILEEDCENDCEDYKLKKKELHGKTYMASALFTAWYLAEKRKKMYQEAGIKKYKPPIFVLISDLCNNETTEVENDYLINRMVALINEKSEISNHKLGFLKALYGNVSKEYDEWLKGIKLDAPEEFATAIHTLFSRLISTVEWEFEKEEVLEQESDEEDMYVFVPKSREIIEKGDLGEYEKINELDKMYDDESCIFENFQIRH